jgi:hypothetical protein
MTLVIKRVRTVSVDQTFALCLSCGSVCQLAEAMKHFVDTSEPHAVDVGCGGVRWGACPYCGNDFVTGFDLNWRGWQHLDMAVH